MRRILLVALVGTAVVALPANAIAKGHAKPATYKTGTYKAKAGEAKFNITLKRASCASVPGQGKSALHLCVALPSSPTIQCLGAAPAEIPLGSFVTPVGLPNSGKVTQQTAVTAGPAIPGGAPTTGHSIFSVTFTKKGTATGYLEQNLTLSAGTASLPCVGKVPFTAKLG